MIRVDIAGAGLAGCTAARILAERGCNVFLYEKDRVGGLCADTIHRDTGLRYSLFGPHVFHTNKGRVWEFMKRFSSWVEFEHFVVADTGSNLVRLPADLVTLNQLCLDDGRPMLPHELHNMSAPVRERLWNILGRHYSERQWLRKFDSSAACRSVSRQRILTDAGGNYFNSRYCAIPEHGYELLFRNMIAHGNITLVHSEYTMDTFRSNSPDSLLYSGRPDKLLCFKYGKLQYIDHVFFERVVPPEARQGCFVKNYTGPSHELLRSTDYAASPVFRGYPPVADRLVVDEVSVSGDDGYGMYPVDSDASSQVFGKCMRELGELPLRYVIRTIGRQGKHSYMDMDAVVDDTMSVVDNLFGQIIG